MADQQSSPISIIFANPNSKFSRLTPDQKKLIDRHVTETWGSPDLLAEAQADKSIWNAVQRRREFFADPEQLKILELVDRYRNGTLPEKPKNFPEPHAPIGADIITGPVRGKLAPANPSATRF